MYACMYIYIYVYIYTCIYIYIFAYRCICTSTGVCIAIHISYLIYIYIYIYTCTCIGLMLRNTWLVLSPKAGFKSALRRVFAGLDGAVPQPDDAWFGKAKLRTGRGPKGPQKHEDPNMVQYGFL